jgi:hypothetical protein
MGRSSPRGDLRPFSAPHSRSLSDICLMNGDGGDFLISVRLRVRKLLLGHLAGCFPEVVRLKQLFRNDLRVHPVFKSTRLALYEKRC